MGGYALPVARGLARRQPARIEHPKQDTYADSSLLL